MRLATRTPKGYKRAQFEDAFIRYAGDTPSQAATPPQATDSEGLSPISSRHTGDDVAAKNQPKAAGVKDCGGVAAQNGGAGEEDYEIEERLAIQEFDGDLETGAEDATD